MSLSFIGEAPKDVLDLVEKCMQIWWKNEFLKEELGKYEFKKLMKKKQKEPWVAVTAQGSSTSGNG